MENSYVVRDGCFFSLLHIFTLQLSLHSSLRLKVLLFTLKISFLLSFQNLPDIKTNHRGLTEINHAN